VIQSALPRKYLLYIKVFAGICMGSCELGLKKLASGGKFWHFDA